MFLESFFYSVNTILDTNIAILYCILPLDTEQTIKKQQKNITAKCRKTFITDNLNKNETSPAILTQQFFMSLATEKTFPPEGHESAAWHDSARAVIQPSM